jgi:hypothetical protein
VDDNMNIEIETRSSLEIYPDESEAVTDTIARGGFQYIITELLRWRTYELDIDGNHVNHGAWREVIPPIAL